MGVCCEINIKERNALSRRSNAEFLNVNPGGRGQLKCDGTRAETRFRLSAKRTSLFKSAGALVQSTTGSRGVRISSSNAGETKFRGSVKGTGYPLHSPVSPSLPHPCVTVYMIVLRNFVVPTLNMVGDPLSVWFTESHIIVFSLMFYLLILFSI